MSNCSMTLTGEHHFIPRNWVPLGGGGLGLSPWAATMKHVDSSVLICKCGERPPEDEVPIIVERLNETARLRKLAFGEEQAEQGRLALE